MRWAHRILLRVAFYRNVIKWTKTLVLPGFGNLSVYAVTASLINEFQEDSLIDKSAALAYNFMLALFPATLCIPCL